MNWGKLHVYVQGHSSPTKPRSAELMILTKIKAVCPQLWKCDHQCDASEHEMALSLDDKLLGEKTHYYCSSSSESEGEEEDETKYGEEKGASAAPAPNVEAPEIGDYKGYCTNTGPKGVINDWRRFKQLETEKRAEQDAERLALGRKLTLTCRTEEDERLEQQTNDALLEDDDFDDKFMKEYRQKRLEEMRKMFHNLPQFGSVIQLTKAGFIEAIDKEHPSVTVVVHVYEERVAACEAMNGCLRCLAQEYPNVKFCRIKASEARLSHKFAASGVPALLVYRRGDMVGNLVRVSDDLGDDFFATDVEGFLHEHSLLPESALSVGTRSSPTAGDDDSDFDVD